MRDLMRKAALIATLGICASAASAQEWRSNSSKTPRGLEAASMRVQKFEFAMEFHCDEHDWEDHRLGVKFFGPALPRLYGKDGDTAKLSLLFTLRDGVLYREPFDSYYFDGGLGDQAWLGSINAGGSELNALARALKLDILNQDSQVVYSFGTKGTAAGVAVLRQTCKFASAPSAHPAPAQAKKASLSVPIPAVSEPTDQRDKEDSPAAPFKIQVAWPEAIAGTKIQTPANMKFAIIDAGLADVEVHTKFYITTQLDQSARFHFALNDTAGLN